MAATRLQKVDINKKLLEHFATRLFGNMSAREMGITIILKRLTVGSKLRKLFVNNRIISE